MTKTVHPVLKKTGAVLLTVLVLVLMAVRRAQAEAPRMAEVQAEEDEYLGFV